MLKKMQFFAQKAWFYPLVLVVFVVFQQLIAIPHTGMTWDEPSSFFFGRANVRFWQTLDRSYIDDFKNPKLFQNEPFRYIYGEDIYPPFALMFFSWISLLFAETFKIFSTIDAHHFGEVLYSVPGILAFYFICRRMGLKKELSLLSSLLFFTYPTVSNQLRSDAKDVPLMSMFILTVFCVLQWIGAIQHDSRKRHVWGVAAAVSFGLTIGTKVTAGILLPIVAATMVIFFLLSSSFRKGLRPYPFKLIEGFVFSLVSFLVFLISWPWLWTDIVGHLQEAWKFFKVVGYGMPVLYFGTVYSAGINLPWHYPIGILFSQTPPLVWPFFISGLLYALYRAIRRKDAAALFICLWFCIGMGRFFVPGVLIYAKVRHFIDAMPAMYLLAGYGILLFSKILLFLETKVKFLSINNTIVRIAPISVLCFLLIHHLFIFVTHAPYEAAYFSFVAGGTKNVAEKRLFDIEYWASAVKEGVESINDISPEATTVYACTMGHLALFYETEKVQVKGSPWEAKYIVIPNSFSWFGGPKVHAQEHHDLVYTVRRNGADLLWVYRFRDPAYWNCGYETNMNYTL